MSHSQYMMESGYNLGCLTHHVMKNLSPREVNSLLKAAQPWAELRLEATGFLWP